MAETLRSTSCKAFRVVWSSLAAVACSSVHLYVIRDYVMRRLADNQLKICKAAHLDASPAA